MTKYFFTLAIALFVFFPQDAGATAYYADLSTTTCSGAGTSTSTAFCSIDAFAEAARAPGDILFIRRGSATTTNISDIAFTSDGSASTSIVISADYDNLWGGFSSSSQTGTVTQGSSTILMSASTTGIVAGDWIYVQGDCTERISPTTINTCQYANQVQSILASTTIVLLFPYNGRQSGSGLTLRVMGKAPIWGTTASGDFSFQFNTDDYWTVKGLDLRSVASTDIGQVQITTSVGHILEDMIIMEGNNSSQRGIYLAADNVYLMMNKVYIYNLTGGGSCMGNAADTYGVIKMNTVVCQIRSSLTGASLVAFLFSINVSHFEIDAKNIYIVDPENGSSALVQGFALGRTGRVYCDNCSARAVYPSQTSGGTATFLSSVVIPLSVFDQGQYLTNMRWRRNTRLNTETIQYTGFSSTSPTFTSVASVDNYVRSVIVSTSTNLRGATSVSNILVDPTVKSPNGYGNIPQQLFSYPIYATTTSKTYSVYFNSTSTSNWANNPTSNELWIQCDYTNAVNSPLLVGSTSPFILTKRSTTTLNFTGSTAWQAITLTCAPNTPGVLMLSGYYAKAKESGNSNMFYVDTTPTIE